MRSQLSRLLALSTSPSRVLPVDGPSLGVVLARPGSEVVVDFWAAGCVACRSLAPSVERLAEERPDVTVVALDVDRSPRTADRYKVERLPTVIRFREAKPIAVAVGGLPYDTLIEQLGLRPSSVR